MSIARMTLYLDAVQALGRLGLPVEFTFAAVVPWRMCVGAGGLPSIARTRHAIVAASTAFVWAALQSSSC